MTSVTANVVAPDPAFSSFTGAERNGYGSYLDRRLVVRLGTTRTLSITTNANFGRTNTVWIDWNQDGTFSPSELVMNAVSNNQVTFTGQFVVPTSTAFAGLTRMRVVVRLNGNVANPCVVGQPNSETEDYLVQVVNPLATLEAHTMPSLSVFPNPTTTGQLHLRLTDGNAAGAYTATVENLLGAKALSTSLQLKPAADATLDLSALPQGIYVLRLLGADGQTALRRIVRE
ncbi:T9SS type A sorting domain-containing protein [Hymenobacter sp. BT175]|nr:T9SS type A sorting domain-containing protein [Hymenobacter translucens]